MTRTPAPMTVTYGSTPLPPLEELRGKRALVTGASRGIGAALAQRLASQGVDVVITGRTEHAGDARLAGSLAEVADQVARFGGRVGTVAADLTDADARAAIVPRAEELLGGPIDILINNAAAVIFEPVMTFSLRRRQLVFEANLHAPLDLIQAVVPGMQGRGAGWIVNVSSATARLRVGPPFVLVPPGSAMSIYGASKSALNRITNGLGAELLGTGVRVNTIEPQFGVLTEGADALVGELIDTSVMEPMESMVEAIVALCRCPAEVTGQSTVSLDLLDHWDLEVRGLDGAVQRD